MGTTRNMEDTEQDMEVIEIGARPLLSYDVSEEDDELKAYKQVWVAVLQLGITDLVDNFIGDTLPRKKAEKEMEKVNRRFMAAQWIANNEEEIGRFLWVCKELSLDAVRIRRAVMNQYPELFGQVAAIKNRPKLVKRVTNNNSYVMELIEDADGDEYATNTN